MLSLVHIVNYKRVKATNRERERERGEIGPEMTLTIRKPGPTARSMAVDIFAIFFGIGSWIGINAIYLQLPLLVSVAPEGWGLPSFIVVIVQIANIGPILYTFIQKFSPWKMRDSYLIYALYLCGICGAILVAFFYDRTTWVGDTERSVPLLSIVFFLALVGCTSSVLFMPYMGRFREIYLITYLIGEGLSGFLPSIVALIQGVGGNARCVESGNSTAAEPSWELFTPSPRFDTFGFFLFVFAVMLVSLVAFSLLDKHRVSKAEYAAVVIRKGNHYEYENGHKDSLTATTSKETTEIIQRKQLTRSNYYYLLALNMVVCMFGNGVFPSIQSYSCLPYGNIAYHLTVTLSSIANPIACFLAIFLPHNSIRRILILVGVGTLIGLYAMSTAVMSPQPPFMGQVIGEILVVSYPSILSYIYWSCVVPSGDR